MPEDSVRPETQTLLVFIRRKGFVGCFKKLIFIIEFLFLLSFFNINKKICLLENYFKKNLYNNNKLIYIYIYIYINFIFFKNIINII